MAKSKTRKKSKNTAPEATPDKSGSKQQKIILAVAAVIILAMGWWWNESSNIESAFFEHVQAGGGTIDHVERHADHGTSGHLSPGERIDYGTNMPTSGRHDERPVPPGFYTTVKAPTQLVHSLEHGLVIVYYDQLDATARATLEDWTSLYAGQFSGLVVARQPGLGQKLVLTAWRKSLTLEQFDAAAAAAFIDAYRGRGPENPVR